MKIGIIDIETTGFLNAGGKIVEIGIVSLDLTNGEIEVLVNEVCHEKPITRQEVEDSWIIKNSSLTVEEVQQSKQLPFLHEIIQNTLNSFENGVTAFNNAFDFGFMESRGFVFPVKLYCPMKLLTPIMKLPHKNGRSGYKWPSVEEAYAYFFPDENFIEEHRGADDAIHEAKIIFEMYKVGLFQV